MEYLKENRFNAYYRDDNGFLVSILLNAEVEMNPDKPDDLIVRTESETYKVDFYLDADDNVTQLDYEGAPISIVSSLISPQVNKLYFFPVCQTKRISYRWGRCQHRDSKFIDGDREPDARSRCQNICGERTAC